MTWFPFNYSDYNNRTTGNKVRPLVPTLHTDYPHSLPCFLPVDDSLHIEVKMTRRRLLLLTRKAYLLLLRRMMPTFQSYAEGLGDQRHGLFDDKVNEPSC